ncbi:MAG: isoprenylcysteine carboxylmethyltransferase family protein [Hyphomicrobiaceae bacterium]
MVWACFIVFLASPPWSEQSWPLPTVDYRGFDLHPLGAAAVNVGLIALFGMQHSLMARPWFKQRVTSRLPPAFERCTYVHAANLALLALILFWQPIPSVVWHADGPVRDLLWVTFAMGWIILLLGAVSFGVLELLGIEQMRALTSKAPPPVPRLKTGHLYRAVPHPMYVGVLTAIWVTPHMTLGHLLLAAGMTAYVIGALHFEERDLAARFGIAYRRWRAI